MITLEFHDPSGQLEVNVPFAQRLDTLEGKKIGIITNDQWQAYRMMPKLKAMLEGDFKGVVVFPVGEIGDVMFADFFHQIFVVSKSRHAHFFNGGEKFPRARLWNYGAVIFNHVT